MPESNERTRDTRIRERQQVDLTDGSLTGGTVLAVSAETRRAFVAWPGSASGGWYVLSHLTATTNGAS